ncbi:hypothetical protein L3Q82_016718 [Scortum barcoo]|uniref:Uncharacterized protein n=1 Tax=Scortum barcoo TaxID=214431 RepID=A0ACB8XBG5_9TELE|nr:hypothetical protein L3Q82_016718 [Scortum barcoo]
MFEHNRVSISARGIRTPFRSEVDDRLCCRFHLISGRMSWTLGPLSGRSSTPTSGRASHSQIPREAGDIESEWTMFSASIVDAGSSKLWTQGLWCLSWRQLPEPGGGHRKVRDAVRLKKESYRAMLACGTPDAVDGYRQAKQAAARTVLEAKTRVWEEFGEAMEEDYRSVGLEEILANRPSASEGGSSTLPTLFTVQGGELLTSTGDIVGRWKKCTSRISSIPPTCLPVRKRRLGTLRWTCPITRAEVTEVVRKLLQWQGAVGG